MKELALLLRERRLLALFALTAVLFCEAAWLVSLTPTEADLLHYECYSLTFWLGSHGANFLPGTACAYLFHGIPTPPPSSPSPLHMLPLEYPPLAILPFSLPLLVPLPYYALSFVLFMTLVAGLIYWLLARSGPKRAAPVFLLYLVLGTAAIAQERFDLLPAACTLLCVLAAERGRWRTAYIALALGVLLKLYPIVMLPALFLAEQAQRERMTDQEVSLSSRWLHNKHWYWNNCLFCLGLLIAVTGGFALLNVQEAIISPLHYFLSRPPQIESLVSSAIWLGSYFNLPYTITFTYGSLNISSPLVNVVAPVNTLLTLIGILAVLWLQWRKQIDFAQTMVGLVCILIATGKVFSPQYLIWLFPLLAYVHARGQTRRIWMVSWAIISLLTTFIYIFYYSRLVDPQAAPQILQNMPSFFEVVALRNLLLLVNTLALLGGWWRARSTSRVLLFS